MLKWRLEQTMFHKSLFLPVSVRNRIKMVENDSHWKSRQWVKSAQSEPYTLFFLSETVFPKNEVIWSEKNGKWRSRMEWKWKTSTKVAMNFFLTQNEMDLQFSRKCCMRACVRASVRALFASKETPILDFTSQNWYCQPIKNLTSLDPKKRYSTGIFTGKLSPTFWTGQNSWEWILLKSDYFTKNAKIYPQFWTLCMPSA